MYKIIFIDIDGTLRNDRKEITEKTKEAIHKVVEKGMHVAICSGRPGKYVEEVSKASSASNYVIACNGGEIYDYEEKKMIYVNALENEEVITLWHMAERYDVQLIMISNGKRIVRKQTDDETDIILEESIENFVIDNPVTQCVFSSMELESIQSIKKEINLKNLGIVNLSKCLINNELPKERPFFLDVTCKGTSKGEAIKKLCKYLKIDLKDSVAIGDSYNDITMFKAVGHSVAMGNAPEDIKRIVDEVTDTNNEDGVAKFLEKLN